MTGAPRMAVLILLLEGGTPRPKTVTRSSHRVLGSTPAHLPQVAHHPPEVRDCQAAAPPHSPVPVLGLVVSQSVQRDQNARWANLFGKVPESLLKEVSPLFFTYCNQSQFPAPSCINVGKC